jgi:hypothetical protein
MKTFQQKLNIFKQEISNKISELMEQKGVCSEHLSHDIVLLVPDHVAFNLDGNRYLKEITDTKLIDNYGYHYNIFVLETEKLTEVVDALIDMPVPNFQVSAPNDNGEFFAAYFETEKQAREVFELKKEVLEEITLSIRTGEINRHGEPIYVTVEEWILEKE